MIERTITPTMLEAAKANPSRLLAFIELETESGWVRVHSGVGPRIYKSQTYIGMGEMGGIGSVTENATTNGNRTTLALKVYDQSLLSEVMNNDLMGRECYGHLVAFDENRQILDGADYFIDAEVVDVKIRRGNQEKEIPAVVTVVLNDWLERWAQPVEVMKTTDAAQQFKYPGDRFFDLLEIIAGSPLSSLPVKTNYGSGRTRRTRGDTQRR